MFDVEVKNCLDKPFGKLANDYILPFKADSRIFNSVVNYVYANLLPDSTAKEQLAVEHPKNVQEMFGQVRKHMKKATIQSAIQTGIREKAKQVDRMKARLLETEHAELVYYSSNGFMGSGKRAKARVGGLGVEGVGKAGENIYGQALMQIRNEFQIEHNQLVQKDAIYLSYIAEINLKKALKKHNLEKYVSKDKKRSMKKLVAALVSDYGKTEVYLNAPDVDTILNLHEKRNIMHYVDPNALIRIIRKNEIKTVLKKNNYDLKSEALKAFVDYTISKNVTLSEDRTALKDQLFDILPSKRDEFADRILNLFSVNELPEDIKGKIKAFKNKLYFPTDKEIDYFVNEKIKLPTISSQSGVVETMNVYTEEDVLSPTDESAMFKVDQRKFKSISQYIAFKLNMLYGNVDANKLYIRIRDVKTSDLDRFNNLMETDSMSTTKNKLLDKAISIKATNYDIKHLLFSIQNLTVEDAYNLDQTQELYKKYKDTNVLKIRNIPSFQQLVAKDRFVMAIVKEKISFYFTNLDNLMVHVKSKFKLNVTYDDLVELSPFNTFTLTKASPVTSAPEYLYEVNKQYGLSNASLLLVWSIVYGSLHMSSMFVGPSGMDIRYKSLMIWAKQLLSRRDPELKTFGVMQTRQEDYVLVVLMAVLAKLKEVNLKFGIPSMDNQDLATAVALLSGKVREFKQQVDLEVQEDYQAEEAVEGMQEENDYYDEDDQDVLDDLDVDDMLDDQDDEFEGFDNAGKQKFEAFLATHFRPLLCDLKLDKVEESVNKVMLSKSPLAEKHQYFNFFLAGYVLPYM